MTEFRVYQRQSILIKSVCPVLMIYDLLINYISEYQLLGNYWRTERI